MSPVPRSSVAVPQSREPAPSAEASQEVEAVESVESVDGDLPTPGSMIDWRRSHPDWACRRPGEALNGNALCRLLAELAEQVHRGRSPHPGLLAHAMACAEATPTLPLLIDRHSWPDILLARDALKGRLFTAAIAPEPAASVTAHHLDTLTSRLLALKAPTRSARTTVQLAEPAEAPQASMGNQALVAALRSSAREIRRPRTWARLGGELTVRAVTRLPGWPPGRALSIEYLDGHEAERYGDATSASPPIRVRYNMSRDNASQPKVSQPRGTHYDAIVRGKVLGVDADGDCFFASVLAGMDAQERVALLGTTTANSKEQIRALRARVADHIESIARSPSTIPEMFELLWIAHAG